jgi:hypothetical protein
MNNDYRLEVFKPEHFKLLDPKDPDTVSMAGNENSSIVINHYARVSYAFTGFYKDDIIAIGGLLPLWPGTAEAWLFTGKNFTPHVKFCLRHIKARLEEAYKYLDLNRIQMVCVKDFAEAHRFAHHLGFYPEGLLQKYMYNRDYLLYSRIKND